MREIFGYDRLGSPELVPLMNEIYVDYWCPLQNFFCPSMKLLRKTRIGGHIKKEYDPARTPYQRLMDCPEISEERKEAMKRQKQGLNPFDCKRTWSGNSKPSRNASDVKLPACSTPPDTPPLGYLSS